MRSEAQREASRINGAKSRGPKTAEGKAVSRLNSLKHGLRAEQVVLPGEDPAEFEAELKGWLGDWGQAGYTAAVLCERAAAASWRMRRAVRAEADRLRDVAGRAGRAFDDARERGLDQAIDLFRHDPAEAVARLEADPVGVGVLLGSWAELAETLAAWSADDHGRLMDLLGRRPGEDPADSGPMPRLSRGLAAANDPTMEGDCESSSAGEARRAAADLLGRIDDAMEGLREARRDLPDPADGRRRAVGAAVAADLAEHQHLHRYEMAHDRSLRATLRELKALAKSGSERSGESDPPQVLSEVSVASQEAALTAAPEPATPSEPDAGGAVEPSVPSEPGPAALPLPPGEARRDRDGRIWAVATPPRGRLSA